MGGGQSLFRREDLEVYEACTCLSGAEILELYEKFVDLGGVREKANAAEKVIRGPGADLAAPEVAGDAEAGAAATGSGPSGRKVTKAAVCKQSELRNNPFKERLCEIFSSEPMNSATWGDLSFDEFVDLYNVMSPRATKEVKTQTAFRIYDFDANGYLTADDIAQLLTTIATTPKKKVLLEDAEIKDIVERVMRDCKSRNLAAALRRPCRDARIPRRLRLHLVALLFSPPSHLNEQVTSMAITAYRTRNFRRSWGAFLTLRPNSAFTSSDRNSNT